MFFLKNNTALEQKISTINALVMLMSDVQKSLELKKIKRKEQCFCI